MEIKLVGVRIAPKKKTNSIQLFAYHFNDGDYFTELRITNSHDFIHFRR